MALAIDTSSAFSGAAGPAHPATVTLTSVPAGSILLALAGAAQNANHTWAAVTDTSSLTWATTTTLNSPAADAALGWSWAACPSLVASTTVSFAVVANNNMSSIGFGVLVFTGASASPIGATNTASNNSGTPSVGVTTTAPGSIVVAVGADFHATPAPTASTGTFTFNGTSFAFTNGTVGATWIQWTGATTSNSGTLVTLSDSAPTASEYAFYGIEILAGAAAAAGVTGFIPQRMPIGA